MPWTGVRARFGKLDAELQPTQQQIDDGQRKQLSVRQCLERAYVGTSTPNPPGFVAGSWGKHTQIRPVSDIDVFYVMPSHAFTRFSKYLGNGQSALLQEVKDRLRQTFSRTEMRGDGQVVVVEFDSIKVELVPVFWAGEPGVYLVPNTHNGGRWTVAYPANEAMHVAAYGLPFEHNVRPLIRMIKCWKRECSAPLKSYVIELLVIDFLSQYRWANRDIYYFDWIVRDFFAHICTLSFGSVWSPGGKEWVSLGADWLSRAKTAHKVAVHACDLEQQDLTILAGFEWQKIFGPKIPVL